MPELDALDLPAKVTEVLDRWPSAGLAVGVVGDGSMAWFLGHGVADIASEEPITQDTVFRIGSITKTVTAIAVMQLWEAGLVDLDARPTTTCAPSSSSRPRPAFGPPPCATC